MVTEDSPPATGSSVISAGAFGAQANPLHALSGAIDIDLSITPFTNTLPIRRMDLAHGQSADIVVAYIRVPELTVTKDPQRYSCIESRDRYRCESLDSDFVREIETDRDGIVVTYPGVFRRIYLGRLFVSQVM
jgi:hypothetical protein